MRGGGVTKVLVLAVASWLALSAGADATNAEEEIDAPLRLTQKAAPQLRVQGQAVSDVSVVSDVIDLTDFDDDDDDTCPFIYDAYDVKFKVGGSEVSWRFSPAKYGFSHGYYCSLSNSFAGQQVRFGFDNCSCPIGRQCNDDWGSLTLNTILGLPPVEVSVGKCEVYPWVLLVPVALAFLFAGFCACVCARRRVHHNIIVIRADPGYSGDYVNLN